jgi:uncharacterized membrane protein
VNEQPRLRVGDTEREAAVAALGEHFAAGRLTKEEYDERSDRAYAARTASDLHPLFADLPSLATDHPASAAPRGQVRGGHWPLGVGVLPIVIGLFVLSALVHAPLFLLLVVAAVVFSRSRRYRHGSQHYRHQGPWGR